MVVRVDFTQKVTLEQRVRGSEEVTHADVQDGGSQLQHVMASPGGLVKTDIVGAHLEFLEIQQFFSKP